MIGPVVEAIMAAVVASLALAGVVQLAPTRRPLAVAVYLLVMAGWPSTCWSPDAADLPATAEVAVSTPPWPPGRPRRGRRPSWTTWPGCSPCASASACTPTPGSAPSCGPWPPTGCAGSWPSTWTATRPPPFALGEAGHTLLARDQRDLPSREAPASRRPWPG